MTADRQLWRFIEYAPNDAVHNMAIDEAILEAFLQGLVPPTLRLYAFAPHAVSLGYAQKISPSTVERIESRGFDVVRRPTGGRAVLHDREMTYSFVAGAGSAFDTVLGASIAQAYRQICTALLYTFSELGVELEMGSSATKYKDMHDCFAATTNADLHFQGKKIVGSAQLRRKEAVLQHGSVLLHQEQTLMASLLAAGVQKQNERTEHHANLYDITGRAVSESELSDAFEAGFKKAFNVDFLHSSLTEEEQKMTENFISKYQRIFSNT